MKVFQNINGKPVELNEYFNIQMDGWYVSKLKKSSSPFYHSSKINPSNLKKEIKLLETLFLK